MIAMHIGLSANSASARVRKGLKADLRQLELTVEECALETFRHGMVRYLASQPSIWTRPTVVARTRSSY
jgi:hypothetical protein